MTKRLRLNLKLKISGLSNWIIWQLVDWDEIFEKFWIIVLAVSIYDLIIIKKVQQWAM